MNKNELVAKVADQSGLSKKDAEKALAAVIDTITAALVAGDKVQLVGFGTFETKQRGRAPAATPEAARRSDPRSQPPPPSRQAGSEGRRRKISFDAKRGCRAALLQ